MGLTHRPQKATFCLLVQTISLYFFSGQQNSSLPKRTCTQLQHWPHTQTQPRPDFHSEIRTASGSSWLCTCPQSSTILSSNFSAKQPLGAVTPQRPLCCMFKQWLTLETIWGCRGTQCTETQISCRCLILLPQMEPSSAPRATFACLKSLCSLLPIPLHTKHLEHSPFPKFRS